MRIYTTKIYTSAPSFETMFLLFAARQTLQNMCFVGRLIQASQTGQTKHLRSVNGSSRVSQTKVFVSLSAAEADQ